MHDDKFRNQQILQPLTGRKLKSICGDYARIVPRDKNAHLNSIQYPKTDENSA